MCYFYCYLIIELTLVQEVFRNSSICNSLYFLAFCTTNAFALLFSSGSQTYTGGWHLCVFWLTKQVVIFQLALVYWTHICQTSTVVNNMSSPNYDASQIFSCPDFPVLYAPDNDIYVYPYLSGLLINLEKHFNKFLINYQK